MPWNNAFSLKCEKRRDMKSSVFLLQDLGTSPACRLQGAKPLCTWWHLSVAAEGEPQYQMAATAGQPRPGCSAAQRGGELRAARLLPGGALLRAPCPLPAGWAHEAGQN